MLKGVDVELNAYRYLWEAADSMGRMPKQEESRKSKKDNDDIVYNARVTELSARLENVGIQMNEARSYARQAIAAYPNEDNQDVLFGYALALHKASQKNE